MAHDTALQADINANTRTQAQQIMRDTEIRMDELDGVGAPERLTGMARSSSRPR